MRTRAVHNAIAWALVSLVALLHPVSGAESGRPPEKTDVRLLYHIELAGDIDCARMTSDLADALTKARAQGAEMILIEPTGRKWRTDVLRDMGRALTAEPRLPMLVFFSSDDHPIGFGQSWLALLADAAYAVPAAKFDHAAPDELISLAPEKTDWELVAQDQRAIAWSSLNARAGPTLLTALLPKPTEALWIAPTGRGDNSLRIIAGAPPESESASPLAMPDAKSAGSMRASFNADMAKRMSLITDTANGAGDVLARRRLRVWRTERVRISSGLADARRLLDASLGSIDADRAKIKASLDSTRDKVRSKNPVQIDQARQTARREIASLDELDIRIAKSEKVAAAYPELLRTPAPGATTVASKSTTIASSWREVFQDRRDDSEKLRTRARTIIATPSP